MFELFDHTADLGLRVVAPDQRQLFVDGAWGLRSMIVSSPEQLVVRETRQVRLNATRLDDLFFDWLSELLLLFETELFLAASLEVAVSNTAGQWALDATLQGQAIELSKWSMEHEVKAITYHELAVEYLDGEWQATVIVDI